jgi:predicted TIM-barrel fold metal-dependent hydrolase
MLFGTDHPFFPPLTLTEKWRSVLDNLEAIHDVKGWGEEEIERVRGGNALALLQLSS